MIYLSLTFITQAQARQTPPSIKRHTFLGVFELHGHRPPPLGCQVQLEQLIMQLGVQFVPCPRHVSDPAKEVRAVTVSTPCQSWHAS